MLVFDSAAIERYRQEAEVRKHQEQANAWLRAEIENCQYLLDAETDPTNVPRRLGRMMTAREFEEKVRKLVPRMQFISGVMTPVTQFKKMVLPGPNGEELWSSVYHGDIMPERSIMTRKTQDVPDPSQRTLHRADLPRYDFVPGHGFVFDERDVRPGFQRVEVPWRPVKKGWRTLLLQMIADKIVRVPDVERVFYSDNTPEWAQGTGRRSVLRPW